MQFSMDEIVLGLKLAHLVEQAELLLAERQRMLNDYISLLARQRGLSGQVALTDWTKGFEEVPDGEIHDQ